MKVRIVTRNAGGTFSVIHENTRYACMKYMYLRWQHWPTWAVITQRVRDFHKCFETQAIRRYAND